MTLKEIYNNLKNGASYSHGYSCICIATCDRYSSLHPDYGKEFIYWRHYGSSAHSISYEGFLFIVHTIFGLKNAKEFNEYFNED